MAGDQQVRRHRPDVELSLPAKARFGKAAETRPRLLALAQGRLAEAEVNLTNQARAGMPI